MQHENQVQIAMDGGTVWVHAMDGSTVGRFSRRFGLDVHTTATAQMAGAGQCMHCTHEPAGEADWLEFVRLMNLHHEIDVPVDAIDFGPDHTQRRERQ